MHIHIGGLLLVISTIFIGSYGAKELPPEFDKCDVDDAKAMECLRDASQKALATLKNGVPALGVLPLDPLSVSKITMRLSPDSPVSINLDFTNETIYGFSDMMINSVSGSGKSDDFHLTYHVMIPRFQMIGDYVVDGKILLLPIKGSGYSNMTLVNLNVQADLMGTEVIKKGEKYLDINEFKLNIEPDRLYMQLDNLFNGDPGLGRHMNNFLNENWGVIYKELKPSIEETYGAILKDISNRIYGKIPFKNIVL